MPPESQNQFNPTNNTSAPENTFLKRKYFGLYFVLAIALFALASVFLLWWINKTSNEITLNSKIILSGPVNHFAGWQTYTNEKYGFEVKYPTSGTNVEVKNIDNGIYFNYFDKSAGYTDSFLINIANNNSKGIKQWFIDNIDSTGLLINNNNFLLIPVSGGGQMYLLNDLPLPKSYKGDPVAMAYIISPDNKYVLIFNLGQDSRVSIENYINQILSTFKFISTSTPSTTSTSTPSAAGITTPPIFAGPTWKESVINSSSRGDYMFTYDNFNFQPDPKLRLQQFSQPSGHLFETKLTGLSDSELQKKQGEFTKYYEDYSKNSGWDYSQDINDKKMTVNGPSADGADGSVWGYVKTQNNNLKLLGLSYHITNYTNANPDGPVEIKCPCDLELKIFVSDIIDINKLTF